MQRMACRHPAPASRLATARLSALAAAGANAGAPTPTPIPIPTLSSTSPAPTPIPTAAIAVAARHAFSAGVPGAAAHCDAWVALATQATST